MAWEGWRERGREAVLACIEDDDQKKVVNFLRKEVHPPEKILATPMLWSFF